MTKGVLNGTKRIFLYAFLIITAGITFFPIVYSFLGALKSNMELLTSGKILPEEVIFDNYIYAFREVNFGKYTINSIIMTAFVVVIGLLVASMGAYALERKKFPGSAVIKKLYLWSMFVSVGSATLYPHYKMSLALGLNETLLGLAIVTVGAQVYNIILIRGFIQGVDRGYEEAAMIDGCGYFGIFFRIIMPLIKPVLGVIGLFLFVGSWNSYLMPMILTAGNEAIKPLAVAVVEMKASGEMATQWSVILAGANITIVPVVIMYIFCNKQLINGITLGGMKG